MLQKDTVSPLILCLFRCPSDILSGQVLVQGSDQWLGQVQQDQQIPPLVWLAGPKEEQYQPDNNRLQTSREPLNHALVGFQSIAIASRLSVRLHMMYGVASCE